LREGASTLHFFHDHGGDVSDDGSAGLTAHPAAIGGAGLQHIRPEHRQDILIVVFTLLHGNQSKNGQNIRHTEKEFQKEKTTWIENNKSREKEIKDQVGHKQARIIQKRENS
jgi:hypothetical protein